MLTSRIMTGTADVSAKSNLELRATEGGEEPEGARLFEDVLLKHNESRDERVQLVHSDLSSSGGTKEATVGDNSESSKVRLDASERNAVGVGGKAGCEIVLKSPEAILDDGSRALDAATQKNLRPQEIKSISHHKTPESEVLSNNFSKHFSELASDPVPLAEVASTSYHENAISKSREDGISAEAVSVEGYIARAATDEYYKRKNSIDSQQVYKGIPPILGVAGSPHTITLPNEIKNLDGSEAGLNFVTISHAPQGFFGSNPFGTLGESESKTEAPSTRHALGGPNQLSAATDDLAEKVTSHTRVSSKNEAATSFGPQKNIFSPVNSNADYPKAQATYESLQFDLRSLHLPGIISLTNDHPQPAQKSFIEKEADLASGAFKISEREWNGLSSLGNQTSGRIDASQPNGVSGVAVGLSDFDGRILQSVAAEINRIVSVDGKVSSPMSLRLLDAEVGELNLHISKADRGTLISIYSDEAELTEFLRLNERDLHKEISRLGLDKPIFDFSDRRHENPSRNTDNAVHLVEDVVTGPEDERLSPPAEHDAQMPLRNLNILL